jgi:Zn-dependent protease
VILAEPSPSQGDLHFSLFGYPVRINPWFWLTTLLLSDLKSEPIMIALWVAAVLVSILVHELGHAVVMNAYGYSPSIVLYSFGGLAIPHGGGRRGGPWGQILISFAGPAAGFLLAAALVGAFHFVGHYAMDFYFFVVPRILVPNRMLFYILNDILYISVLWGLVNLLPVYPLDGGQIAQQVFMLNDPRDAIRQSLVLSVIVGGIMAAVAFLQWKEIYVGILFVWLTYSNYMTLQAQQDRGGW